MIQLKTGGAFGFVDGLDGKKVVVILNHEQAPGIHVSVSVGVDNMVHQLGETGTTRFDLPVDEDFATITISAIDSDGNTETFIDPNGGEHETLTLESDLVTELIGMNLPDLILPSGSADIRSYSLPRKEFGEASGALLAITGDRTDTMLGDYLFDGVVQGDEEETIFYECERTEGSILWPIRASYRMFYLGARVRLAKLPESKEPLRGARHVDKVMLDVTGLLMGFPYHLGEDLPNLLVVKKSGGVVAMKSIDQIILKNMLVTSQDEALSEMANMSFAGEPGEAVYEVQLSTGERMTTDLVTVNAYDGVMDSPRLISYKDGADYIVQAIVAGEQAAIRVTDLEDDTIEHIQVVEVIDGSGTFRMSSDIVSQGMRANVAYENGAAWSPVSETTILDVSSTYGVKPTGVVVEAGDRSAFVSFEIPMDLRYAGTLLYYGGQLSRDIRDSGAFVITALEPSTTYTFQIAHYDIDGFESERTDVTVVTIDEPASPEQESISLHIDNIKMTYKI